MDPRAAREDDEGFGMHGSRRPSGSRMTAFAMHLEPPVKPEDDDTKNSRSTAVDVRV